MKKGQLAIFMIVGIGLLMIIGILFMLRPRQVDEAPIPSSPVDVYVKSCLHSTTKEGTLKIAMQGGYYEPPAGAENYFSIRVPYYWDGVNRMPTLDTVEEQLSIYIINEINTCLDNFSYVKQQGYKVTSGSLSVSSRINDDSVDVNLEYGLEVSLGDVSTNSYEFSTSLQSDFGKMYQAAKSIMEEQSRIGNSIPWGHASSSEYYFESLMMPGDKVMYTLTDDDMVYAYMAKYNWDFSESPDALEINPIPIIPISENFVIHYQVTANKPAKYSDHSDFFNITEDGLIEFVSEVLPDGQNSFLITAEADGMSDVEVITFVVDIPDRVPVFDTIPPLAATAGARFQYTVEADDPTGEFMYFLDDSPLFDIDTVTGSIDFVPQEAGTYHIVITAVNSAGITFEDIVLVVS